LTLNNLSFKKIIRTMTFDNSKTIIAMRIRLFITTVLLLAYIILTYIAEIIKFPIAGINDTVLTIILVGAYFLFVFYPMVLNYQYIFYSDEGDKIIFRFFTAGIIGGKKNLIKINKVDFAGYRKERKLFGLIQSIILFHQMPEGVAMYPPVYISILSSKERAKILHSLYLLTPGDATEVKK
jgi:hypothetical protein